MANYANDLAKYYGPTTLGANTNQLYQMLAQSPQFQFALQQNALSGQNLSNNLNARLAQSGLSGTGIGAVSGALGQSAGSFGESSLRGGLFGQAGNMALENLLARLQAYSSYKNAKASQPGLLGQIGGGILGAAGSVLAGPLGSSLFGPKSAPAPQNWNQIQQAGFQGPPMPNFGYGQ